ncbi:MAG: hypothetical protein KAS16_07290 [Thermoplasmata archaeon]|nr:hypothetical protein [Thermoplasmata archaeon]
MGRFMQGEGHHEWMSEDGKIVIRKGMGQSPLKIAVVGCGGMGCNALRDIELPEGIVKLAVSSDRNDLTGTHAKAEMVIGEKDAMSSAMSSSTRYAGNDSEMQLSYLLKGYDMVIPIAGLGGNNGGWLASLVCRAARMSKATPLALVTTPLSIEGSEKRHRSTKQLEALRKWTSAVIYKNDLIFKEIPNLPMMKAFKVMNKVVATPVGEINGLGQEAKKDLKRMFDISHIFRMDVAEWRADDPVMAINEEFRRSGWLSLDLLDPKCAILFIRGFGVNEDMAQEFSLEFTKKMKNDIPILVHLDDSVMVKEIRVTALVGL